MKCALTTSFEKFIQVFFTFNFPFSNKLWHFFFSQRNRRQESPRVVKPISHLYLPTVFFGVVHNCNSSCFFRPTPQHLELCLPGTTCSMRLIKINNVYLIKFRKEKWWHFIILFSRYDNRPSPQIWVHLFPETIW